jgi:hypothetical protein
MNTVISAAKTRYINDEPLCMIVAVFICDPTCADEYKISCAF